MTRFWCQGAADSHSSFITHKKKRAVTKSGRTLLMVSCDFGSALDQHNICVKVNLQGPKGKKESKLVRDSKDSPKHEGVKRKGMNDCNYACNIVFNVCLSICLSFCLSACPSVHLSVCLSDLILSYLCFSYLSSPLLPYLILFHLILSYPRESKSSQSLAFTWGGNFAVTGRTLAFAGS